MDETIKQLIQFGVAGIIAVMWYIDKRNYKSNDQIIMENQAQIKAVGLLNEQLIKVVEANTAAITKLSVLVEKCPMQKG